MGICSVFQVLDEAALIVLGADDLILDDGDLVPYLQERRSDGLDLRQGSGLFIIGLLIEDVLDIGNEDILGKIVAYG